MKIVSSLLLACVAVSSAKTAKLIDRLLDNAAKVYTSTDDGFIVNIPGVLQAEVAGADFNGVLTVGDDNTFELTGSNVDDGSMFHYQVTYASDANMDNYGMANAVYTSFSNYKRVVESSTLDIAVQKDLSTTIDMSAESAIDGNVITTDGNARFTVANNFDNVVVTADGKLSGELSADFPDDLKVGVMQRFPFVLDRVATLTVGKICTNDKYILNDGCRISTAVTGSTNGEKLDMAAIYAMSGNVLSGNAVDNLTNEKHTANFFCKNIGSRAIAPIDCGGYYHVEYISPENQGTSKVLNIVTLPGQKVWKTLIKPALKKKTANFRAVYNIVFQDRNVKNIIRRLTVLIVHLDSMFNKLTNEFNVGQAIRKSRLNSNALVQFLHTKPEFVKAAKVYLNMNLLAYKRLTPILVQMAVVANNKIVDKIQAQNEHIKFYRGFAHQVSGADGKKWFDEIYG